MCDQDGVGVDTTAAEQSGAEATSLAERYSGIAENFRTEMSILSDNSSAEMPVVSGALDYCADIVGQLIKLQVHTAALGTGSAAGAAAARRADSEVGTGLGTSYPN